MDNAEWSAYYADQYNQNTQSAKASIEALVAAAPLDNGAAAEANAVLAETTLLT